MARRITLWGSLLTVSALVAACGTGPTDPATRTAERVEAFAAAWAGDDPDALSAFYADEVRSYDATAPGASFGKDTIDGVLRSQWAQDDFEAAITSYFVSPDGSFAATLGTFVWPDRTGSLVPQPYVSLLAFEGEQLVWVYDYYGGAMPSSEPMPAIPPSTLEPGSPEAQTAIADATAAVQGWIAAYNDRDVAAFLAGYADAVRYVDVVSPDWRVLTRAQLADDVASHFARADFESRLGPSDHSPIGSFLISVDGRLAAVEGAYEDEGTIVAEPMVVILELEGGRIVEQHNFIVMERDLLDP